MSNRAGRSGDGPGDAAARLTGRAVAGVRGVTGALSEAVLDDGRVVMVKRGEGRDAVRAEAAGLRWLAAPGALRVPRIHGEDGDWLVTERVPAGRATREAAVRLGGGLAALHSAGAPAFGAPPPGGPRDAYIGAAPMHNGPAAGPDDAPDDDRGGDRGGDRAGDWPRWYAEQRVLPYVRRAADAGTVRPAEARVFEALCERLPVLAGPPEPPARLHGDLWNGNVLWGAGGEPWVIDPAAHGGHRETDLAMLRLFGCPYLDVVLEAYQGAAPLADGWAGRVGLHQLFPLLVHAVLFGRGYAEQALGVARSALGR
ncbi:fructosamine kinase family protein [Streptomyces sp. NPDC093094]|uniref:fructosamine kinase family protein n=1 Tax=Streptomyces sp. NPDC093094 TaxID=3366026 RepID=UPI003804FB0C